MDAGIAATAVILVLAVAPRVALRLRATQSKRRFHREFVAPLREFARDRRAE